MREFDLVVYGASGFTGQLVCDYLTERYAGKLSWAVAGRDQAKLTGIKRARGWPEEVPVITADSSNPSSLDALAGRTRLVISTAGPYQVLGSPVVASCVGAGTHYVDLSGEPAWMSGMLEAHAERARTTGARIVFACGFDSVPFDLGVKRLQDLCIERTGRPAPHVKCRIRALQGGISGGTAASLRATQAAIERNPNLPLILADPYLLTRGFEGPPQPEDDEPRFDDQLGRWLSPFYMTFINTKIVHRTNLLAGQRYGAAFLYDEMVMMDAPGDAGREGAFEQAQADPFDGAEHLQSGDGPSFEVREAGFFDILFITEGLAVPELAVAVTGRRDPGYGATSRIITETALTLLDSDRPGGFWTPGTISDGVLEQRLAENADVWVKEETESL